MKISIFLFLNNIDFYLHIINQFFLFKITLLQFIIKSIDLS